MTSTPDYVVTLEAAFSDIVKQYNQLQINDYNTKSIHIGNALINYGVQLLKTLRSHTDTLETLLSDCSDFIKELKDEVPSKSIFVTKTKNNMLSYPNKPFAHDVIDTYETAKSIVKKKKVSKPKVIVEDTVNIPELNYQMKLPVVTNLNDIPSAMYYHRETNGVYIKLHNNNIFRIPFPDVVDSRKDYSRKQSIRCKYKCKEDCDDQRVKMASMYNSQIRTCNFAHKGDKLIKIGYHSRCPSVPNFGNLDTIASDIKLVNDGDVKSLLLYGLNDMFMASLWMDYIKLKNKTIYNLCVV
jgi:hypothetical protein